jgi:ADP-ribose pyrophosphatase YjhB (NUDIX family)
LPVVVMLVPVEGGLLAVRRGIEPGRGKLALPGGYLGMDETWQEAGAREVFEETGVTIDPAGIREIAVRSTRDGALLIFGLAAPLAALPAFQYDAETLECAILEAPAELAFPLHTEIVAAYFRGAAR